PESLLNRNVMRNVAPPVPVGPVRRGIERANETPRLFDLVVAPGGVAGFGNPDLGIGIVAVDYRAHFAQMQVPAAPVRLLAVPGPGKAVQPDRGDDAEEAALAHHVDPVGI